MNGNKWFGFDDEYSIRRKSEYIISMGLGGGMLWSVDTDDFNGQCGKAFPLLVAMNEVLNSEISDESRYKNSKEYSL